MRWLRWLWPWRRRPPLASPGVRTVEHEMPHRIVVGVDPAIHGSDVAVLGIVGPAEEGHVPLPRYIGPRMKRPRWWQFWRRRRWRRECAEAHAELLRWFGAPLVTADPPSAELISQYLLHDSERPFEVVAVEPTDDGAVSLTLRERQHGIPKWIEGAMERKQEAIDEVRASKPCDACGAYLVDGRCINCEADRLEPNDG